MNGGTRLAIAILCMWGAMICFYFAFHPGGVEGVSNPSTALQWLSKEFQTQTGSGGNAG